MGHKYQQIQVNIQGVPKNALSELLVNPLFSEQLLNPRPGIDQRLLIDGNSESAFFWDTLYVQVVSYIVDVLSSTWVLMYWQVEAGDGRSLQLVAFQAPEHPHSAPIFLQFLLQL